MHCFRSFGVRTYTFNLLTSPHYEMEYRIDVVDATNDKVIGTGLITAQGLLQQQRDFLVEEKRTTKAKYTQKEIEKCCKAENGVVNYDVHRPVGPCALT